MAADKPRGARSAAAIWSGPAMSPAGPLLGALRQALGALDIRAAALAEINARRLFLWLPVCLGVGIILCFVADGTPSPWPALAVASVCLLGAWRLRDRIAAFACLIAAAFVLLGFAAAAWRTGAVAAPILDRPVFARFSAFVETVDAGPEGGRAVLTVTAMETAFLVTKPNRVRVTFKGAAPRAGDHVVGQARLVPPPQPAFPGGYDFARDAYFLGLGAVGRWTGPFALAPATAAMPRRVRLSAVIDNARTDMTNRIAAIIGGQAGALSAALVTGKRGLISESVNDDMRAAGIYHIVSISGLHMVLAAGVFFWLARAVLALLPGVAERRPVKKWAAATAMIGATAYCVFSGNEVATERSLIMTLTMLGAILFDRPALSMRNLAISALIVLLRQPETMLGPSFQMSFAAVAGMIAANEWWQGRRTTRREPSAWGGILVRRLSIAAAASIATTLIASIATAPFAAYHFQRLNPYGLIGNALAIPFVSFVVMPAAVAGTLLMPFGLDGPIWSLMGLGSAKVVEVARYVAEFQGSVRGIRAFPVSALVLMSVGSVVIALVRAPIRIVGLLPLAIGLALAARPAPPELMVDREGRAAVFRAGDGGLAFLGRSASRFTLDRWLAADGDLRKASDPSLRASSRCDRLGCTGRMRDGSSVALVLEAEAFEEDCARARLVITPLLAPDFCRASAEVFDQPRLASSASIALHWNGERFAVVPARPPDRWKPWFGRPNTTALPSPGGTASPPARMSPNASRPEQSPPAEPPETQDDGADLLTP
jgi:competence protein ComEC